MAYPWKVTYSPGGLATQGNVGAPPVAFLSPVSLTTQGLIHRFPDIWFDEDAYGDQAIQSVTWTPCECNDECDS